MSKKKGRVADAEAAGIAMSPLAEIVDLPHPAGPGVGQQLRDAREAAGLDIQEVARTLKFHPRQIELLEGDDFDALPGNTFVRGFVRSYARFLKLDAERLVHQLDARAPSLTADVRPPDNMGAAKQPWDVQRVPLALTAGILLVVMAAVAFALWHFYGPALSKFRDGMSFPPPAPPAAPVATPLPVDNPAVLPPRDDAAVVPAATPGAVDSPAALPPEALPPRLVFVFSDRSWIEVTDGTRKIIHSGEHQAGSQLKLDGVPPFDLVVGNPTKVKLAYGERSIDLAPHTRADVARLKVE